MLSVVPSTKVEPAVVLIVDIVEDKKETFVACILACSNLIYIRQMLSHQD